MKANQKLVIKCPTCNHPAVFDRTNKFRPFCSERCRLIDLGEWIQEKYKIPSSDDMSSPSVQNETDFD